MRFVLINSKFWKPFDTFQKNRYLKCDLELLKNNVFLYLRKFALNSTLDVTIYELNSPVTALSYNVSNIIFMIKSFDHKDNEFWKKCSCSHSSPYSNSLKKGFFQESWKMLECRLFPKWVQNLPIQNIGQFIFFQSSLRLWSRSPTYLVPNKLIHDRRYGFSDERSRTGSLEFHHGES